MNKLFTVVFLSIFETMLDFYVCTMVSLWEMAWDLLVQVETDHESEAFAKSPNADLIVNNYPQTVVLCSSIHSSVMLLQFTRNMWFEIETMQSTVCWILYCSFCAFFLPTSRSLLPQNTPLTSAQCIIRAVKLILDDHRLLSLLNSTNGTPKNKMMSWSICAN